MRSHYFSGARALTELMAFRRLAASVRASRVWYIPLIGMVGETVGNYTIIGTIGEGGMGAVYAARHTLIGRKAAIKMLLPELSRNQEVVNRFFNEARAATAIEHPAIVEIYDFGYHTDQSAYIVMEHLAGESLEARLRRFRRLAAEEALSICRQTASGLAAAHKAGIIHRDLKPDNIFIVPDPDVPGGERAKILDFGIAKLVDRSASGPVKTRTGAVMGTPSYMSPEQCRGGGRLDHRSDIYSVGCLLFEMLCGRPPFLGEGAGDVLAQHIYQPPPAPRSLDPTMAPELEALILRLLAKDPGQRVQTADELIAALDQLSIRSPFVPRAGAGASTLALPGQMPTGTAPQTTLGAAASATVPGTQRSHQRRTRSAFLAPAAVALVLALGGLVIALTRNDDRPDATDETEARAAAHEAVEAAPASDEEPPPAPEPRAEPIEGFEEEPPASSDPAPASPPTITVEIDSKPPGAFVYQMPTGTRVGTTPFSKEMPAADGELEYVLRKKRYEDETVLIPAGSSSTRTVSLTRTRVVPQKASSGAGARPRPKPRKKESTHLDPFESDP